MEFADIPTIVQEQRSSIDPAALPSGPEVSRVREDLSVGFEEPSRVIEKPAQTTERFGYSETVHHEQERFERLVVEVVDAHLSGISNAPRPHDANRLRQDVDCRHLQRAVLEGQSVTSRPSAHVERSPPSQRQRLGLQVREVPRRPKKSNAPGLPVARSRHARRSGRHVLRRDTREGRHRAVATAQGRASRRCSLARYVHQAVSLCSSATFTAGHSGAMML